MNKLSLIKDSQLHEKDTGSIKVQITLLKHKIDNLKNHISKNKQDKHNLVRLITWIQNYKKLLNQYSAKNK